MTTLLQHGIYYAAATGSASASTSASIPHEQHILVDNTIAACMDLEDRPDASRSRPLAKSKFKVELIILA
jgi:hypothetical protein